MVPWMLVWPGCCHEAEAVATAAAGACRRTVIMTDPKHAGTAHDARDHRQKPALTLGSFRSLLPATEMVIFLLRGIHEWSGVSFPLRDVKGEPDVKIFMKVSLAMCAGITGLVSIGWPTSLYAADAASGETVFKSQCSICHSVAPEKNMIGPSLFGIVGRKSGSVVGFHYSAANKGANLTWDPPTLNRYLTSPRQVVPGTSMTYAGLKDDTRRADLVVYLQTVR
jgi:cytochrome c